MKLAPALSCEESVPDKKNDVASLSFLPPCSMGYGDDTAAMESLIPPAMQCTKGQVNVQQLRLPEGPCAVHGSQTHHQRSPNTKQVWQRY
jgi:hypothetical protein